MTKLLVELDDGLHRRIKATCGLAKVTMREFVERALSDGLQFYEPVWEEEERRKGANNDQ